MGRITEDRMATGRCLCGGVRYEIAGEACSADRLPLHTCARTSGNFAVMAGCKSADLRLPPSDTLNWYQSSESVQRGFCSHCGGNLFWKAAPGVETYATLGTLDRPTGLRLGEHIYVG